MAISDSTLNVDVVTSADIAALKQVQTELNNVLDHVKNTNDEVKKTPALFDVTRSEAAALSRELTAGEVSARSLGVALAGLGTPVAVAAIAVFTFIKTLMDAGTAANKLNEENQKLNEQLVKTAQNYNDIATAALTQQDLGNLARRFTTDMAEANAKVEELTQKVAGVKAVTGVFELMGQELKDIITIQSTWTDPFVAELANADAYAKKLMLIQQQVAQVAENNVEWARSLTPIPATIDKLNTQYLELKMMAQAAADANDPKKWAEIQAEMIKVAAAIAMVTAEWNKIVEAAKKFEEEQAKIAKEAAAKEKTDEQKAFNAALREAQMILQGIHEQQTLIKESPFLGADEKQVAMVRSYREEIQKIEDETAKLQAMKPSITDTAELARVNAELQKMGFSVDQLHLKLDAAMHPLQAQLQSWVNSWGTASQQIGKMIEDTIGRSLEALNTWIVTGKFNLQSFMQQIEMLGLKLLEQLILQRVMAAVNRSEAAAEAAVLGPIIASAFAPAATAVTIATEGQAALAAPEEYLTALLAIQGIAVAHTGGEMKRWHNGGLASDEVPIIAQTGEIMMRRDVAQANRDMLLALNAGKGRMHPGGEVHYGGGPLGPGGGTIFPADIGYAPPFGGGVPAGEIAGAIIAAAGGPPPAGELAGDIIAAAGDTTTTEGGGTITGGASVGAGDFGPGGSALVLGPGGGTIFGGLDPGMVTVGGLSLGPGMSMAPGGLDILGSTGGFSGHMAMKHRGGEIERFHSGGRVSGAGGKRAVNIYAFTDLKAMTKHMASAEGQKIIFDTVRGSRIDLGISGGGG